MSETPIPARFWWLRRGGGAAVALLAVVAVAHVALGRWAEGRLAAERAAWVAAGHVGPENPVEEFPAPIGEDNAAVWIVRASGQLPELSQQQFDDWDFTAQTYPPTGAARAALLSIVRQDGAALTTLRRGRKLGPPDWGDWPMSVRTNLPLLSDARQLGIHVSWAVMNAVLTEDVVAALELVTDATWLAAAVADYGPSHVSTSVSCNAQAAATDRLRDLLNAEISPEAWRAARPQARVLIDLLLDDGYDRKLRVGGFAGDWYMTFNSNDLASGGGVGERNLLTAPFFDAQVADSVARTRVRAEAAKRVETFAAFRPLMTTLIGPEPDSLARVSTEKLAWTMTASLGPAAARISGTIRARRTAAVSLAVRLYESEHGGQTPATLRELVPEYLPFVPIDPNSLDGSPLDFDPALLAAPPATRPSPQ